MDCVTPWMGTAVAPFVGCPSLDQIVVFSRPRVTVTFSSEASGGFQQMRAGGCQHRTTPPADALLKRDELAIQQK